MSMRKGEMGDGGCGWFEVLSMGEGGKGEGKGERGREIDKDGDNFFSR